MKKCFFTWIIIIGISAHNLTLGQAHPTNSFVLNEKSLISEIVQYNYYLEEYSLSHKLRKYALTLNYERLKDTDIITLKAVFNSNDLKQFNPSNYTLVNNKIPLFIHTGLEEFGLTKIDFLNIFQREALDCSKDSVEIKKRYGSLSSMLVRMTATVPFKKDVNPATDNLIEIDDRHSSDSGPRSITLTFYKLKLIKKRQS